MTSTREDGDPGPRPPGVEADRGPFAIECPDGAIRAWYLTETGAESVLDEAYEPSLFVAGPDVALEALSTRLAADPKVTATAMTHRYTTLHDTKGRAPPDRVLSVSLERIDEVRTLAREIKHRHEPAVVEAMDGTPSGGSAGGGSVSGGSTGGRSVSGGSAGGGSASGGSTGGRSASGGSTGGRSASGGSASGGSASEGHAVRIHEANATAGPGTLRLFDVDLTPGFRYCLDRGVTPACAPPDRELRWCRIGIGERALAEGDVSALTVDGDRLEGSPAAVLESLAAYLDRTDPDVLVLCYADLVPLLFETADEEDVEGFRLGRLAGWTQVAGENSFASYGQVGHSPARYRVPGRAIVDESNSFLWHQSGPHGLLYMVEQSGRPLQEAAWGSIGTLLTSRQVRMARRERDVVATWNKWEPERFKDVRTLHDADRGGFTFAPDVGFHEEVHEIDFASLYPRIICEHNVSPETVDCACCDPDDGGTPAEIVPKLGYHICQRDGFLPDVLEPLLRDRAAIKRRLREVEADDAADEDGTNHGGNSGDGRTDGETGNDGHDHRNVEVRRLRGRSGAIKWVLVSCFGYQGYRNAKFGRIECHEAINAYAREIALDAKDRLEAGGWRIVHGIVDSLWVTPAVNDPEPLESVLDAVTDAVGIALEHDGTYEWVCFVPRRATIGRVANEGPATGIAGGPASGRTTDAGGTGTDGTNADGNGTGGPNAGTTGTDGADAAAGGATGGVSSRVAPAGTLTRYFGKRTNGEFKLRGIEARQRSTPEFVTDCQRELLETLDATRDPTAVCDRLGRQLGRLERGAVDPADLVITKRVSKPLAAYTQSTHTVAALERYRAIEVPKAPGQSVEYVVVDDARRTAERVRLAIEDWPEAGDGESDDTGASGRSTDRVPYDADYYARLLVRAAESVVSPLGWDRTRIRRYLADGRTVSLSAFVD